MPLIPSQRHLYDIPEDVAYFNTGYMSPLMNSAQSAGEQGLRRKQQPWHIQAADFFSGAEVLRGQFALLINAQGDDIALVPSASYGISVAAQNLPLGRGQQVLLLEDQFPSNVYPWRAAAAAARASVLTVARPNNGDWTTAVLSALDKRIAIAALPECHWTDGGRLDLERIGSACRSNGTALVLDLTQSLGVLPFDVHRVQPDFVACAGYKWLQGPYSLSYLYAAKRWQVEGRPLEHSWMTRRGAENFARLVDYTDDHAAGARRFDVGEFSNFALLPAAAAALQQILEWGVENIAATLTTRANEIAQRLTPLGLRALPTQLRAGHYLGLRMDEGWPEPSAILQALAEQHVFASVRGASIRITPYLYNTAADIDRLVDALAAIRRIVPVG